KAGEKPPAKPMLEPKMLMAALAVAAQQSPTSHPPDGLKKLIDLLLTQQAKDGSWRISPGNRPPINDSAETITALTLLAITPATADTPAGAVGKTETEMGLKWLAAAPSPDNHQALVVRLLLQERLGHAGEVLRPLLQKLLKLQNPDGGWSQTKEMPS